jgi:hypothetical protein
MNKGYLTKNNSTKKQSVKKIRSPKVQVKTIINPETGRKILIGGPTYQKLVEKKLLLNTRVKTVEKKRTPLSSLSHEEAKKKGLVTKIKKLPGCSSFGKYKDSDGPFCGEEGYACDKTYPVGTKSRMNAAIRYARESPNPEGIIRCAVRKGLKQGFLSPKQATTILNRYELSTFKQKNILKSPKKRSVK